MKWHEMAYLCLFRGPDAAQRAWIEPQPRLQQGLRGLDYRKVILSDEPRSSTASRWLGAATRLEKVGLLGARVADFRCCDTSQRLQEARRAHLRGLSKEASSARPPQELHRDYMKPFEAEPIV